MLLNVNSESSEELWAAEGFVSHCVHCAAAGLKTAMASPLVDSIEASITSVRSKLESISLFQKNTCISKVLTWFVNLIG